MREVTRFGALVAALLLWSGCAGGPRPLSGTAASPRAGPLKEEFDPRSIPEDLLLIQPSFPRPAADAPAGRAEDRETAAEAVVLPRELPPAPPGPEPVWATVYRAQIMALRNEQMARQRAAELAESLGVPVSVEAQGQYFVVRVGNCEHRDEAEALKDRLAARHPDYAGAFVVEVDQSALVVAAQVEEEPPAESLPAEPEPTLVPAFGWRVLLHQFLAYAEADRFRKRAVGELGRTDVQVIFKAPWYKVEFGNFRTEIEAQQWVEVVREEFPNALRVRGQILVPQEDR